MNAKQKLIAKIATQTTEELVSIAKMLNLNTGDEEMVVSAFVAKELEQRMPELDFISLMDELEKEMMAA